MLKNNVKSIVKLAVHAMITHDMDEWPSACLGMLYQPMRPKNKTENEQNKYRMDVYENYINRT